MALSSTDMDRAWEQVTRRARVERAYSSGQVFPVHRNVYDAYMRLWEIHCVERERQANEAHSDRDPSSLSAD